MCYCEEIKKNGCYYELGSINKYVLNDDAADEDDEDDDNNNNNNNNNNNVWHL